MQGLQNQMFGVFIMLFVVFQVIIQIIPVFVIQRELFEACERQSKTYAWQAFVLSNIMVEMFWNSVSLLVHFLLTKLTTTLLQIMAVFCFFVWYYPIGFYRNASASDTVSSRAFLAFLLIWTMFLFASSFAHLLIAGISSEDIASAIATLIFILMYAFCGILAGPKALPRFWIFMYRVNPITYLVSSLMATALGNAPAHCAENEFQNFAAPGNQTCAEYLEPYISMAGGYVEQAGGESATCNFCQLDNTNQYLQSINVNFSDRWWHFALLWVYIVFNVAAAIVLYWAFRVPKTKKIEKQKKL